MAAARQVRTFCLGIAVMPGARREVIIVIPNSKKKSKCVGKEKEKKKDKDKDKGQHALGH